MNKYQKQALVDMFKVALGILAVMATIAGIIKLGMSASDIVGGISLVAMLYFVYQLYLIRVVQLEAEDRE